MSHYRIAEIGGDGIGPEVVGEAVRVLQAVQSEALHFTFERAEVGAALYRRTGDELPRETVDLCRLCSHLLDTQRPVDYKNPTNRSLPTPLEEDL